MTAMIESKWYCYENVNSKYKLSMMAGAPKQEKVRDK